MVGERGAPKSLIQCDKEGGDEIHTVMPHLKILKQSGMHYMRAT